MLLAVLAEMLMVAPEEHQPVGLVALSVVQMLTAEPQLLQLEQVVTAAALVTQALMAD
jgi:hypothetical protein